MKLYSDRFLWFLYLQKLHKFNFLLLKKCKKSNNFFWDDWQTLFLPSDESCVYPKFIKIGLSIGSSSYLFIYLYFVSFFLWNCKKNILQLLLVSKLGQSSRPIRSQIRPRHFQDSFIHSDTLRITPYTKIDGEKCQTKMTS